MHKSVSELVDDLTSAWNRGDASTFAGLFTADADYVTGAGIWLHGQPAIAELMRSAAPLPRVRVEGQISARDYGAVSSVMLHWVTEAGTAPRRRGVITCLLVKSDAGWLIDRLHNTDET